MPDATDPIHDRQSTDPDLKTTSPDHRTGRILESLALFLIGVMLMHHIHTGTWGVSDMRTGPAGHDSFYHLKMAALIPEHGLLRELPWIRFAYFTQSGHDFVSHHYGFHVLLSPFVHLSHWLTGDYLAGGRWLIAVCFGLNLMLFGLILRGEGVAWRWLWLLFFVLLPFQFFTRHAYIRAICPSLTFMLLIVWLMFRRRNVLAGLAVAGGVIYAPLLVIFFVASSFLGPPGDRTLPWRLIVCTVAGWVVGILTHPYAGGIAEFLYLQVFGSGLSPDIPVGREWKPYEGVWWFATMTGPLLMIWAIAVSVRLRTGPVLNARELTLLLVNFGLLALTMKARRFVEYWPIFCLLSAACLVAPVLARLAHWLRRRAGIEGTRLIWSRRVAALLCVGATFVIVQVSPAWHQIRRTARSGYDMAPIREAMTFLKEHSDRGDVVFTDDWDIFPVYFYFNSHNHYIVGLDPKFTHQRRPALWERSVKISRGQVPADITVSVPGENGNRVKKKLHVTLEDIREHFGARFVITDRDHKKLAGKLAKAEEFAELIYPSASYNDSKNAPYLSFQIHDLPNPRTDTQRPINKPGG